MRRVHALVLSISAIVLLPLALTAGTMKRTVAQIVLPHDGEPVQLAGLIYKARFTAEVTSVRLDPFPAPGSDPVVLNWVFTGNNTDAQMHRFAVTVTLLDEAGKDLAWDTNKTALRPGAKDQLVPMRMSVPRDAWERARRVALKVDWFS